MKRKFQIITDSSCDMPREYFKDHELECVNLGFTMDNVNYEGECGADISSSEFYKKLLHLVYFWYGDGSYPFTPDKRYVRNGEPTDELLEMEYFIITGGSYGNDKNRVELAVERKGKLAYILEIAFPRYRTMRDLYPVLKSVPILLPLFYPIRWIHYTVKGKSIRFAKYIFSKKKTAKK